MNITSTIIINGHTMLRSDVKMVGPVELHLTANGLTQDYDVYRVIVHTSFGATLTMTDRDRGVLTELRNQILGLVFPDDNPLTKQEQIEALRKFR